MNITKTRLNCNSPESRDRRPAAGALLFVLCAFLTSCANPPRTSPPGQYVMDPSLLPDGLRVKLQDEYPLYLVQSASIEVARGHASAYHIELVSGSRGTLTHRETMEGRVRPGNSIQDRNPDGLIDFETHRIATPGSRDWSAFDDDYDGFYDRRRWHGYHSWNVPVHIPVSSWVQWAPTRSAGPEEGR